MKIYIETEMTELPKGCRCIGGEYKYAYCPLFNISMQYEDPICLWNNREITEDIDIRKERPSWCPLRTETEIADMVEEV